MYDSIAARVKREVRVASLAVVFVPFRFISLFGYNIVYPAETWKYSCKIARSVTFLKKKLCLMGLYIYIYIDRIMCIDLSIY